MILTIFVLRKLAMILDYCTDRLDNLESVEGSGRDEKTSCEHSHSQKEFV